MFAASEDSGPIVIMKVGMAGEFERCLEAEKISLRSTDPDGFNQEFQGWIRTAVNRKISMDRREASPWGAPIKPMPLESELRKMFAEVAREGALRYVQDALDSVKDYVTKAQCVEAISMDIVKDTMNE